MPYGGRRLEPVSRAALPIAVFVAACASTRATPAVAVPVPTTDARSHPPGVAVDPVLLLPRAADFASTDRGVVVLTEPVDTRAARRVIDTFFVAVAAEALDDLASVCEATAETRVSPKSRPERLLAFWDKRFERLDYHSLSTEVFYRESEMEVHTARDAATVATSRALPALPKGAEVLVRTPIVGSNSSRLFGSDLVFLLRPSRAGYKIAKVFEDFRLP